MHFIPGFMGTTISPTVLTFQTSTGSTSNLTTYTFSSVAIGTAATDRLVIVAVYWESGSGSISLASGTIGGVTADISITRSGSIACALMTARVPTGTTATITVTLSGGATKCAIGVWSATGVVSATPDATGDDVGAGSVSAQMTVPESGFLIAAAVSAATGGVVWGDATERFDASLESSIQYSGADVTTAGDVEFDVTDAGEELDLVAATWR